MKFIGTSLVVGATVAAGMIAGAYLVMDKPCARKMYRYGKRYLKKMADM